jgi:hypothetical protein
MIDFKCPYCGADQEVNHDDGAGYDENRLHEQECSDCEKTYVFDTAISFTYTPKKADCLNGAEHRLKFRKSWPHEYSKMCCQDCDYKRQATETELSTNDTQSAIAKAEGGAV